LARVETRGLILLGKLPIEIFALPGESRAHVVCSMCGTLVALDERMLAIH
jgi:hypothetical protein